MALTDRNHKWYSPNGNPLSNFRFGNGVSITEGDALAIQVRSLSPVGNHDVHTPWPLSAIIVYTLVVR